eukprot:UN05236
MYPLFVRVWKTISFIRFKIFKIFKIESGERLRIKSMDKRDNFWSISGDSGQYILLDDMRELCIDYVEIVIPSLILNESQQIDLNFLLRNDKYTHTYFKNIGIINFELLYGVNKNNIEDFDLTQYKSTCIDHKNTLILLRNNFGNIFGGFTSRGIPPLVWPWNGAEYFMDKFSFLFKVSDGCPKITSKPKIFPQLNSNHALLASNRHIAIF